MTKTGVDMVLNDINVFLTLNNDTHIMLKAYWVFDGLINLVLQPNACH